MAQSNSNWLRNTVLTVLAIIIVVLGAMYLGRTHAAEETSLFTNINLAAWLKPYNELVFIGSVALGAIIHYINDRAKGKTASTSFMDYWFRDAPGHSMATVIVLLLMVGGTLQTGEVLTLNTWTVFNLGLLGGYTTNSLVNQGAPPASNQQPAPSVQSS